MLISQKQQRFSPSQPHRCHPPNRLPRCTTSLPVEPKKSFIYNKIRSFREPTEPNEPKEPKPARRPQLLRQGCGNQNTKRTQFFSQPEQNETSYRGIYEPVSTHLETHSRTGHFPPAGRRPGAGIVLAPTPSAAPTALATWCFAALWVAFRNKRSEYGAVGLSCATTCKRCS